MTMQILSYQEARVRMKAGDVIAFGGSSHFSEMIKTAIRAEVSHIGIILQTQVADPTTGEVYDQFMDSTSRQGVRISRVSDRLNEYDGDVWWLPLRRDLREAKFSPQAFDEFLRAQEGKKYDRQQAIGSAIDVFDQFTFGGLHGPGYNKEDYTRLFCSELVAAGLKAAGVIPASVNASEVTPVDLCRWNIYEPEYYLLKGAPKEISGYNSCDPARQKP